MTTILVFMLVVVAVAVLALAYAAFPHRGASAPGMGWVIGVVERAADAVPMVEDGDLAPLGNPLAGGVGRRATTSASDDQPVRR